MANKLVYSVIEESYVYCEMLCLMVSVLKSNDIFCYVCNELNLHPGLETHLVSGFCTIHQTFQAVARAVSLSSLTS
jgi:NAD kinase